MELVIKLPKIKKNTTVYAANDCTVTAIGNALHVDYELALDMLSRIDVTSAYSKEITIKSGRKFGKNRFSRSVHFINFIETVFNTNSIATGKTVSHVLQKFPKGTYIALMSRHTFVVHNGAVVDGSDVVKPWSTIIGLYEVKRSTALASLKKFAELTGVNLKQHKDISIDRHIEKLKSGEITNSTASEERTAARQKQAQATVTLKGSPEANFKRIAKLRNVEHIEYGAQFNYKGERYTVIELNPNLRKTKMFIKLKRERDQAILETNESTYNILAQTYSMQNQGVA